MNSSIRCVIFDFDGTIVDSNQIKHDAFYEVTAAFPGASEILDDILDRPDFGDRYAVFRFIEEHLPAIREGGIDGVTLAGRYTRLCAESILAAQYIPGAIESLSALSDMNLVLAISSATPERDLYEIVHSRGIASYFAKIMGGPRSKYEHVLDMMKTYELLATEVIYVGDSEVDRLTALETGSGFIGIGKNGDRFDEVPAHLMDNLADIAEKISHW